MRSYMFIYVRMAFSYWKQLSDKFCKYIYKSNMFCFNDFLVVVKRVWLYSGAFLMSYKKIPNKTSSNRRVFFPINSFSSPTLLISPSS